MCIGPTGDLDIVKYTHSKVKMRKGVKSGRITTHYSAAEISNLIKAANMICKTERDINSPTLTLLRCMNKESVSTRVSNVERSYVNISCIIPSGKTACSPHKTPTMPILMN